MTITRKKPSEVQAKPTVIRVANQHTGPIIFPRRGGGSALALPPLVLHPGTITEVPAEEWASRKKNKVVQHYMDRGLLAEVRKAPGAPVPILDTTSTELPVPEHLQTENEEQQGASGVARAAVRRKRPGTAEV